ncbi:MAG: hypothetical protein HY752_06080 [Nitrospirae bacterium]|nr:hypothetical protein [Nitrospirota bacterium]
MSYSEKLQLKSLSIKLLGIISAITILTLVVVNARSLAGSSSSGGSHIFLYLILCLLPAFASIFMMLAQQYWISFGIGIWFLFIGIADSIERRIHTNDAIFLLAAITMCSIPFLNMIFVKKINKDTASGKMNSEQDSKNIIMGDDDKEI